MTLTKSHPATVSLWLLCSGYFLWMLLLGLDHHWSFKTSIYDTGVFDQAIWSCLNGEILLNTINFGKPINWLGFHFHPLLFLFVPLYKLSPSPEWLIIGQALAITAAAIPVYKTALKLDYSEWQGVFWAAGFLFNPFVLSAALWDFHPVAIATPIIGFCIYFLVSNQFSKLLACCALLLLCQEQFGLLLMCLGISHYLVHKNIKQSLAIVVMGLVYTLIVFMYVFPALSPTGAHIMMSSDLKNVNRYNWLGNSLPAIIKNILLNPLTVLKIALIDMSGYDYLLFLFTPYGLLLPFRGLDILLIAAADFAANFLSFNVLPRSIHSYHSITLIPVLVVSTMAGLARIRKNYSSRHYRRMAFLLVISFVTLFTLCFPYILGRDSFWLLSPFPAKKDSVFTEIQSFIPSDASLSVQGNIGSHFSQRSRIYAFPNKVAEADFIILKLEDMDHTLAKDPFRFAHHMLMEPEEYLNSIQCLLGSKDYSIRFFKAPWLVFSRRDAAEPAISPETVHIFLDSLKKQWNIDTSKLKSNSCSQIL